MQVPLISAQGPGQPASQLTGAQPFLVTTLTWISAQASAQLSLFLSQLPPQHAWPGKDLGITLWGF